MSLLLDTHVWIWSQECPEKLGPEAARRITDSSESLHVATISTLEIAQLIAGTAIDLRGDIMDWVTAALDALGAGTLELSHAVAVEAYRLPGEFHKDPADRILVATARQWNLVLATADERILGYPHVRTLDARA